MKIYFIQINKLKKKQYTYKNTENAVKKYYQLTNSKPSDKLIYTPLIVGIFIPGTYKYITHIFSEKEIKNLVETKGYKKTAELIEEIACCKGYHDETPF